MKKRDALRKRAAKEEARAWGLPGEDDYECMMAGELSLDSIEGRRALEEATEEQGVDDAGRPPAATSELRTT